MTGFRGLAAVAAVGLLVLAAGCAGQNGDTPGTDQPGNGKDFAADEAVIQVEHTGGFTTPEWIATRLPVVVVYGDGRVITPGAQIAIYPAPALPSVQVHRIPAGDVGKLADAAVAAGVGSGTDYGRPAVADLPSTVFRVQTAGGVKSTEVYALEETTGSGLNEQQKQARIRLKDLIGKLTEPGTSAEQYKPAALAAVVSPHTAANSELGPQPEIAWPGPELPGAPLSANSALHCVTVTGAQLEQVLTAAQKANALTPWKSAGKLWTVTLRPLLPHESGCADLGKAS